jgi:hypothetical protein
MAEPIPAPTAEEIEGIVDMTMLSTAAVTAMLSAYDDQDVANVKWSRTLQDFADWDALKNKKWNIRRVGSIEFFEGDSVLLKLINRVRSRYGQTLLLSASGRTAADTSGYAVTIVPDW